MLRLAVPPPRNRLERRDVSASARSLSSSARHRMHERRQELAHRAAGTAGRRCGARVAAHAAQPCEGQAAHKHRCGAPPPKPPLVVPQSAGAYHSHAPNTPDCTRVLGAQDNRVINNCKSMIKSIDDNRNKKDGGRQSVTPLPLLPPPRFIQNSGSAPGPIIARSLGRPRAACANAKQPCYEGRVHEHKTAAATRA